MPKSSRKRRDRPRPKPGAEPALMRIGVLARRVGLTNQMVHLYCNLGLLREAARTPAGYRLFAPDAVRRVQLIQTLLRRGYTLRDMRQTFRRGFEGG